MEVISWLGAYYVECEVYEHAVQFFERAALIQPQEIKWQLMIASCYRRSGSYQQAFDTYKRIHMKFPENIECEFVCICFVCLAFGVFSLFPPSTPFPHTRNTHPN